MSFDTLKKAEDHLLYPLIIVLWTYKNQYDFQTYFAMPNDHLKNILRHIEFEVTNTVIRFSFFVENWTNWTLISAKNLARWYCFKPLLNSLKKLKCLLGN